MGNNAALVSMLYYQSLFTLTLKAPIMTTADDIYKKLFHCFPEKIRLDILCESSAEDSYETSNLISLER